MKANHTPLTPEQSDFAAAHHNLIYSYLNKRGLSVDKFYDIAVFGYLRAVRKYFEREDLREYKFSTIAYPCMQSDIGNHFRAQKAQMRTAEIIQFDDATTYNGHYNRGFADEYDFDCENIAA